MHQWSAFFVGFLPELFLDLAPLFAVTFDEQVAPVSAKFEPGFLKDGFDFLLQRHEEMQSILPGSRLVVIEESGHMTTMEQPGAVSVALRDWLYGEGERCG